jgi:hypothetical protein
MTEEARSGKADTVILLLQEILVDVVGITIPGFCFLVSAGAVLGFPLYDLTKEIGAVGHAVLIQSFINQNLYFPAFIALMIFSFVVGHLLYRRDPKNPDLYSMRRCRADLPSGWRRGSDDHCRQFPYGLLKDYLKERGFEQLANYVPWSGTDFTYRAGDSATSNWISRTKHFINKKLELLKSYSMNCGFTKLAEYIRRERIEFPHGTHPNPARRSKHFINIKSLRLNRRIADYIST